MGKQEDKKITIWDVARLSGLSKGTVDRVIHGRGEVSKQSRQKVLEVIKQIDYKPNMYASLLASKKQYSVLCLIPEFHDGEYWELVHKGIMSAIDRAKDFNIDVQIITYEQFSNDSFREACAEVLRRSASAVMLAPMYKNDTLALTCELKARGVPCVYIDSRLEESHYLAYYGVPMYQSGYLAASLLIADSKVSQIANFRIERGASPQDNPTLKRREGFMEYVQNYNPNCTILEEYLKPYDAQYNFDLLDTFFAKHPDIKHIVTFNSRVHLVCEYLEQRSLTDKILVGFDKLQRNMDGLRNGSVRFLITQRTETQVYSGISAIIDNLIKHVTPSQQDNYMSLDILTKYNVDYYFDRVPI